MIRRTTIAALSILALAGAAGAQFQWVQSAPAAPPDPIDATSNTIVSSSSVWSISSTQDGHTYKIDGKDGAVTAEIDGTPVPADRVALEGDAVSIKDEKGNTLFATQTPASGVSGDVFALTSPRGSLFSGPRALVAGPRDHTGRVEPAAPPVMIGVQLLEPDASLRGHLGLKENESTMIGAVYDGLPASLAGLEPYDIIVAINGKSPAPVEAVRSALRDTEAGKSVSLRVIHRGQEKTLAVSPEKYDQNKLDKAKVNAIAAASGTPGIAAFSGALDPDIDKWAKAWAGGNGAVNVQPFIATPPGKNGKPMTLWFNNTPGAGGQSMNDFAHRMQEMAEQMRAQAEAARLDADRLREQLLKRVGPGPAPGAVSPGMDDRMKNMEDMLRKLMEQREKQAEEKTDARS
ncbi:MAG TPA: PDZ domain-containing protein [Phycisphaerales bacterium]|mgnify:CR=1 FL=1|nr:PDZ domain-containing protein [Phycisphaerales bacterium]